MFKCFVTHPRNFVEEWHEEIRVVVRGFALNDGGESLESHPTVDVLLGQRREGEIILAANEHTTKSQVTLQSTLCARCEEGKFSRV